jgi:hypothetical protein
MQLRATSSGHACHGHGQHGRATHYSFDSFRGHVDWFPTRPANVWCMHLVPCGQHTILEVRTKATLNTSCFVHVCLGNFISPASDLHIFLRELSSAHAPPTCISQVAFLLADTVSKPYELLYG